MADQNMNENQGTTEMREHGRNGGNNGGGRMSKSQLLDAIAQDSGISKKQASSVIDTLDRIVAQQLKDSGEATIPGLVKFAVTIKPATPEREGINPFTKQPTTFKAKPERKVVKARILKGLKDNLA